MRKEVRKEAHDTGSYIFDRIILAKVLENIEKEKGGWICMT